MPCAATVYGYQHTQKANTRFDKLTLYRDRDMIQIRKEDETMPRTPAANRATAKWEAKAYDHVNLRLPKGTKERIQAQSTSVNGYISAALLEKLKQDEQTKQPPT